MDTVSMLDKMRFYCQPILPLVYDESMSYYETLCKVVGQLNTTGETVNKLNEGLTGEIADRQAADAELDERLKVIEDTNKKIHFLVFDGANPNVVFPTRRELYQWVEAGDAIFTLLGTYEEGRGQIYAASCSYNAGNWGSEASNDFSIIVPLETTYDSTGKLAVKQKVAKLTIPPIPQTNLNAPWGLQIIEINTPSTSAEGIVNFSATVDNENTVHANLSPAEFTNLYRAVSKGSGLIVGVNAQLTTNDSQLLLSTTADIIGGETASDDEVRIVFDAETSTGEWGLDLPYLNRLIYILTGSGTSETWTLTEFKTYDFAFDRYEGFQFTRAANNAITPAFGSTPKDVAEYFGTVKGGTPYQNLPVRLIDTVDNAEYWNGVFDIKDGNHMTFTFVTSNYVTASGKMLVRVIELSANRNTTEWKYAEKEFELPLNVSNGVVTYTASKVGDGEYKAAAHKTEYQVDFAEGVPAIITSIEAGNRVILRVDLKESGSELGATPLYFASGYTRIDIFSNAISYVFSGSISNGHYTLELNSGLVHATLTSYGEVLPEPNPDGTDNGKVPTVNGTRWEMKKPVVDDALSDTSTNPVQNKAVKAALDEKLDKRGGTITGGLNVNGGVSVGTGERVHITKAADDAARLTHGAADVDDNVPAARLKVASPTEDDDAATKAYVDNNAAGAGAVRYDAAQTLTFEQQKQARKNIEAADSVWPTITGGVSLCPEHITDSNDAVHVTTAKASSYDFTVTLDCGPENALVRVDGIRTPTDTDTNAAATVEYVLSKAASDFVVNATPNSDSKVTLDKTFAQIQAAIQDGKQPVVKISDGENVGFMPMVAGDPSSVFFAAVGDITDRNTTHIGLTITADDVIFDALASPGLNDDSALLQYWMESDPVAPMDIATKKYVDNHAGGTSIRIKLVTSNAATSTATFAEIKEVLEAGKAPILDSAPGTSHWFALNWTLSGTDRLTIQYGEFNVDGGGKANFTIYDVSVSSLNEIKYSQRQFTTK